MKNNNWKQMAYLVAVNYGGFVDWDEGYFLCPECGEPIYEDDWANSDLIDGNDNFICPVCEEIID